jgi:hypothetical protein
MMTPYALFGLIAAEEAGYPCPNPGTIDRGLRELKQYLDHTGAVGLAIRRDWKARSRRNGRQPRRVNDALFCLWVVGTTRRGPKPRPERVVRRIEKTVGAAEMSDTGHALALELAVESTGQALAEKLAKELRARAQKAGDRVFWTKAGFSRWGDNTTEVTATVMKALVAHDPADPLIPGCWRTSTAPSAATGGTPPRTPRASCTRCATTSRRSGRPGGRRRREGAHQRHRGRRGEARRPVVQGAEVRRHRAEGG